MPRIPLSYHAIESESLYEVLRSYEGRNHEELITDFEAAASNRLLNRPVVATSSGTAALHLALAALNIKAGDYVAVPTFAYVGVINPVLYLGAIPVWIDSESTTWNLDPDLLSKALKQFRKIKAIIVVHNYGVPADMHRIMKLARDYKIPVVEDAAEAWGAKIDGKPCGIVGDLGIISFNNNKTVTALGGGLVVTRTKQVANRIRFLASQARLPKSYYEFDEVGYNYRMSPLIAAYGLTQIQKTQDLVAARITSFEKYCQAFKGNPLVSWAQTLPGHEASRWLSAFSFRSGARRDKIRSRLNQLDIETRIGWNPLHTMNHLDKYPRILGNVSEKLFHETICLPGSLDHTIVQEIQAFM